MIAAMMIAVAAANEASAQQPSSQGKVLPTTERSKYLETGGERKLEIVYKKAGGAGTLIDCRLVFLDWGRGFLD
jgi:hypothetical protein